MKLYSDSFLVNRVNFFYVNKQIIGTTTVIEIFSSIIKLWWCKKFHDVSNTERKQTKEVSTTDQTHLTSYSVIVFHPKVKTIINCILVKVDNFFTKSCL